MKLRWNSTTQLTLRPIEFAHSEDAIELISTESLGEGSEIISSSVDLAEPLSDILIDALAPISAAFLAGRAVSKHCKTDEDKLGYGSLAAGGAALFACTPVGGACLGIYASYRLARTGIKLINRMTRVEPVNVQVIN